MLRCHSPALINNARVPCRSEKSSLSPPRTRRLITTFIPRNLSLGTPPHCQAEVASAQERGSGNLCLPVRGGWGGWGSDTSLSQRDPPGGESRGAAAAGAAGGQAAAWERSRAERCQGAITHRYCQQTARTHASIYLFSARRPLVKRLWEGRREGRKRRRKTERGRQAAANPCVERLPAAAAAAACICVCVYVCVCVPGVEAQPSWRCTGSRAEVLSCASLGVYTHGKKRDGGRLVSHIPGCARLGGEEEEEPSAPQPNHRRSRSLLRRPGTASRQRAASRPRSRCSSFLLSPPDLKDAPSEKTPLGIYSRGLRCTFVGATLGRATEETTTTTKKTTDPPSSPKNQQ